MSIRHTCTSNPIQPPRSSDLIAFDSPFVSDPSHQANDTFEEVFKVAWKRLENASTARGWFDGSPSASFERVKSVQTDRVTVSSNDVTGSYIGSTIGSLL